MEMKFENEIVDVEWKRKENKSFVISFPLSEVLHHMYLIYFLFQVINSKLLYYISTYQELHNCGERSTL